jgi:hypothetical protein
VDAVSEPAHVSRAAERLIEEHLDSVGTLDLLLLLHQDPDRTWSSDELCQALRCPETWGDAKLTELGALGVVVTDDEGRHRYRHEGRFGPAVDQIALLSRRDRGVLTRRIFARSPFAS